MNSKLLYTYFRHERKQNGKDKMENIHMRKEETNYNTNNTWIPMKNTDIGSATLLEISWKHTTQGYIGSNPFSFFRR